MFISKKITFLKKQNLILSNDYHSSLIDRQKLITENNEQENIIKDFLSKIDDMKKRTTISRLHTKMESNSSKKPSIYKNTESLHSYHVSNYELKEETENVTFMKI